jgi:hypothetical protein
MAWDFAIDPATGDWLFGANRDLQGIDDVNLDRQRIMARLKIPQGSFRYDDTGLLGSRLNIAQRYPIERGMSELHFLVSEALLPMMDIVVQDVDVKPDQSDPQKVLVIVKYIQQVDPGEVQLAEDETEELEVSISI